MHDLVIRGGTVVDGTGAQPYLADVAVRGGRIAAVGAEVGEGRQTIDAKGLLVTPGFVDIHTHFDGQVVWDSHLAPTVWHGVSTVVMGNCGVGFAPARPGDQQHLIDMMATVEDIPAESLEAGLDWAWESYPEYLKVVDAKPHTINIASMITHAPLRIYVMGDRAREKATDADIAQMAEIVRDAMRGGAVGLSSSRTILHTTSDSVPIPGTDAEEAELTALARAVREGGNGRGVLEISPASITVDEPKKLADEVDMMIRVARATGCPVVFSLVQSKERPRDYRDALDRAEAAFAEGVPIYPAICTRPISTLLGFQGAFNPFAHLPSYAPLLKMPFAERIAALKNPAVRERLLTEEVPPTGLAQIFMIEGIWEDVYKMGTSLNYYPKPEDAVQFIADRTGQDPKAVAYDAMLENGGRAFLMYAISNWGDRNRAPLRDMLNSPATVLGLADGGAHVTAIVDSSQPTSVLIDWVRGRAPGDPDGIPLETAVHKLTQANARLFGLEDRGVLREGLRADINVIDFDALDLTLPQMVDDLPLGRPRLDQRATGFVATIVNGERVLENGELTGNLPGRIASPAAAH